MLNHYTGWKIAVQPARDGGCYIVAPNAQVDAICQLLTENGVSHAVEESGIRLEGMTLEMLIRMEPHEDAENVQRLLDASDDYNCALSVEGGQPWYG